jgi:hypothetical protein
MSIFGDFEIETFQLGREPINLQGRRPARVRYASIADVLLHSSATTLVP